MSQCYLCMSSFDTIFIQELKLHFLAYHKKRLGWTETSVLYNKWYIFMLFTEMLILVSVILKIISEYTVSYYLNTSNMELHWQIKMRNM